MGPPPQQPENLEDQMRGMNLGNAAIANLPALTDDNGRGRGRGQQQYYGRQNARGFHYNSQSRASHGQQQTASNYNSSHMGGHSATPNRGNSHRPYSSQTANHQQVPHTTSAPENPFGPPRYTSIQNNRAGSQSNSWRSSGQSYSRGRSPHRGPNILQRPYTTGGTANAGYGPQTSPNARYHFTNQFSYQRPENPLLQTEYLDTIAKREIAKVEITAEELAALDSFLKKLEGLCQKAFKEGYSGDIADILLRSFGSLASGFAMPGSDMDIAIVPVWKDPSKEEAPMDKEIPRLLEKAILEAKLGARLLTRARVPILKVCESPSEELYTALCDERKKWDELPEEKKWKDEKVPESLPPLEPLVDLDREGDKNSPRPKKPKKPQTPKIAKPSEMSGTSAEPSPRHAEGKGDGVAQVNKHQNRAPWLREKVLGPLDFPKHGVGIQCDFNFGNPLGLHNTSLLRCYSLCDTRVRPIILFVKAWAKRRKINSSYSGTLSSYGWVLMALHYLINIASPPVLPNLQLAWRPPVEVHAMTKAMEDTMVQGYEVRFWRNEEEIMEAAREGRITTNKQTIGELLKDFFHYYASPPPKDGHRPPSFYWMQEVISLRTLGGIRTKEDKGWKVANKTIANGREVRNRYLFAIEDPFELDHNVARTVTHNGIVAIRDEFRRAWRILSTVGRQEQPEGDLFDEVVQVVPPSTSAAETQIQPAA